MNKNEGIEEELGDVLFTVVNLSRHLNYNPETALKSSIDKFAIVYLLPGDTGIIT